jgi:hypothetical protein
MTGEQYSDLLCITLTFPRLQVHVGRFAIHHADPTQRLSSAWSNNLVYIATEHNTEHTFAAKLFEGSHLQVFRHEVGGRVGYE